VEDLQHQPNKNNDDVLSTGVMSRVYVQNLRCLSISKFPEVILHCIKLEVVYIVPSVAHHITSRSLTWKVVIVGSNPLLHRNVM